MKRARQALEGATVGLKSMAAAIAASWALPSDFPPYRMRNEYTTEETALFKVFEEHKPYGTPGANEQLRDDTHVEFIFQDILRNRVSYVRNPTNATWTYQWCFGRTSAGVNTTVFFVSAGSSEVAQPSHATATSTFKPHTDVLFAENDQGKTGVWVDSRDAAPHSVINVILDVAPTTATGSIILYKWEEGRWLEEDQLPYVIGTTAYQFQVTDSALYTVGVNNPLPEAVKQVSVNSSGSVGCWGHFPAPYIVTNGNSIESCRTLGHSILVKNTAAPLVRQGYITGVQPGKSRHWYNFATNDPTVDVFPVARDYAGAQNTLPLATGIFGYVKPTEEQDLKLREPFTITNPGGDAVPVWTFAKTPVLKTEYVVVVMQCTTSDGRDLLVRTDQSGEFETGNQFFNVDKPRAEPQEMRDGMGASHPCNSSLKIPRIGKGSLQALAQLRRWEVAFLVSLVLKAQRLECLFQWLGI